MEKKFKRMATSWLLPLRNVTGLELAEEELSLVLFSLMFESAFMEKALSEGVYSVLLCH